MSIRLRLTLLSMRDLALVGLPLVALVVAAFWIAYRFVKPAPPDTFVLATGREEGAYHAVGQRYQELLEREGITVVLQSSAGSVENLANLADEDSDVEIAFVYPVAVVLKRWVEAGYGVFALLEGVGVGRLAKPGDPDGGLGSLLRHFQGIQQQGAIGEMCEAIDRGRSLLPA